MFNTTVSLELLENAVRHTLNDESFAIDSPLAQASKKSSELLVVRLEESKNGEKIELTLNSIVLQLCEAFQSTVKTLQSRRDKMLGHYHTMCTTDQFVGSWEKLCEETGIQPLPTLYQHLPHTMFKELIKVHFPVAEVQSSSCETSSAVRYEEANAVRYVAGYVCRAVRENIMSCNSPLKQQLLICMWKLLEDVGIDSSGSEGDNQQKNCPAVIGSMLLIGVAYYMLPIAHISCLLLLKL